MLISSSNSEVNAMLTNIINFILSIFLLVVFLLVNESKRRICQLLDTSVNYLPLRIYPYPSTLLCSDRLGIFSCLVPLVCLTSTNHRTSFHLAKSLYLFLTVFHPSNLLRNSCHLDICISLFGIFHLPTIHRTEFRSVTF